MKAIEQYSYVVLFIMLYKVVLTLTSANKILTIQLKAIEHFVHVTLFIILYKVVRILN